MAQIQKLFQDQGENESWSSNSCLWSLKGQMRRHLSKQEASPVPFMAKIMAGEFKKKSFGDQPVQELWLQALKEETRSNNNLPHPGPDPLPKWIVRHSPVFIFVKINHMHIYITWTKKADQKWANKTHLTMLPLAPVVPLTRPSLSWKCRHKVPGVCLILVKDIAQACLGKSICYPRVFLGEPQSILVSFCYRTVMLAQWNMYREGNTTGQAKPHCFSLHRPPKVSFLQVTQKYLLHPQSMSGSTEPDTDGQHDDVWCKSDKQRRVSYINKVLRQNQSVSIDQHTLEQAPCQVHTFLCRLQKTPLGAGGSKISLCTWKLKSW